MSTNPPSLPVNFYREGPTPRPVDPHWKCQQSGECCSLPAEVVMTRQERSNILPIIPDGVLTIWRDIDETFVALKAQPCPFFLFGECEVYEVRPYNCRRFACLRPDPKSEPFEFDNSAHKLTGCKNADDRFYTSRVARRMLKQIQSKAQRWGARYGWV